MGYQQREHFDEHALFRPNGAPEDRSWIVFVLTPLVSGAGSPGHHAPGSWQWSFMATCALLCVVRWLLAFGWLHWAHWAFGLLLGARASWRTIRVGVVGFVASPC